MTEAQERLAKLIKTDGNGLSPSVCGLIREVIAEINGKCKWVYDDTARWFSTECGTIVLTRGIYCPHCGKEVVTE